jgi:hypothetical protein
MPTLNGANSVSASRRARACPVRRPALQRQFPIERGQSIDELTPALARTRTSLRAVSSSSATRSISASNAG